MKCGTMSLMKIETIILGPYTWIINIIGRVSMRISPKVRDVLMNISLLMLATLGVIKYLNSDIKHVIHYTKDRVNILGFILLIILLVVSIDRQVDYKRLRCRRSFVVGWLVCFGMMLMMSFVHPVVKGYFLWTLISLLFAIPFAIVWHERDDFVRLCDMLARSVLIVAGVFYIVNLIFVPFIPNILSWEYLGIAKNPNNNGFICTSAYAAALYMMMRGQKRSFVYAVIMGFSIAMTVASTCRTAELTIAMETIVGCAYYLAIAKNNEERIDAKKMVTTVIIVLVVAVAGKYVLEQINHMDLNVYAADEIAADAEMHDVSSGRFEIWKAFIAHSTFWGNGNKTKGPQIEGEPSSIYAHNNALEILYSSGVIAFVGYIAWIASGFIFVLRCLLGKYDYHKSYILVVMAFIGYFTQAMLEILIYPMCNIPTLMMYVCLMPIVLDMRDGNESE